MNALSAWINLLRKEWRESREAIIAGIVSFWVCPALLELFGLAIDPRRESFSIAWAFLIVAGWLYAVIVGAHVVCRDWGKPEERFLLAQPVSPRVVVSVKLFVGAVLVAGVIAIAIAWDTLLSRFGVFSFDETLAWLWAIQVARVMAVGYAVAFAAAVMSRQMLASTVVACLLMLIWITAPLLSSVFARFVVLNLWPFQVRLVLLKRLALLSGCAVLICVTTSLFYATRERAIRLGSKPLAWAVGLVVLALFSLAMREVGDSLRVRDQAEVFDSRYTQAGMTRFDNHFFLIAGFWHSQTGGPMVTFRVTDDGHIQGLQRAVFPYAPPGQSTDTAEMIIGFGCDEAGRIIVTGKAGRFRWQADEPKRVWRAALSWPSGGQPKVVSFDVNPPEALLDKNQWLVRRLGSSDTNIWVRGFDRPGGDFIQVVQQGDLAYLSDRRGLRVARQIQLGQWEIIGESRTSPLAMLFRQSPQPELIDDSLLIECSHAGLTTYDVSNPSRPLRNGFFSAVFPYRSEVNTVMATKHYLVLREYNLITVLDRPDVSVRRGAR